jgi:acetylornithine/succinyldiaminopimelate/putrescine aminotransferase
MLVREAAAAFQVGDHGTTLGGNPLVCAAALATLRVLDEERLLDNARAMGARFVEGLQPLDLVSEVRGRGLMIGVETAEPIARRAMAIARDELGVLVNATGDTTLRLVPPLVITVDEVDEGVAAIGEALARASAA